MELIVPKTEHHLLKQASELMKGRERCMLVGGLAFKYHIDRFEKGDYNASSDVDLVFHTLPKDIRGNCHPQYVSFFSETGNVFQANFNVGYPMKNACFFEGRIGWVPLIEEDYSRGSVATVHLEGNGKCELNFADLGLLLATVLNPTGANYSRSQRAASALTANKIRVEEVSTRFVEVIERSNLNGDQLRRPLAQFMRENFTIGAVHAFMKSISEKLEVAKFVIGHFHKIPGSWIS